MAVYNTGGSVSLGAQHRMERIAVAEELQPTAAPDMPLQGGDILPAAYGRPTGFTPIFDLLSQETGIVLQDSPPTLPASTAVALHNERLQDHESGLRLADPAGLSPATRPELIPRVHRNILVARHISGQLGQLARAELTPPRPEPEPEREIMRVEPSSVDDADTPGLLGPSFKEILGNNDWLWLLALSDHPVAPFAQLSLKPTELGPSITDQLDPAIQKRYGF